MPKIRFILSDGSVREAEAKKGESMLQIALDHNVPMEHACGGNGFCTTCMCEVKEGKEYLSQRNDREENMGITEDNKRLGCQATVEAEGDVTIGVIDY